MTALIITVVAVVLISATCSLLEAVLYSVPQSQVESLAESGARSGLLLRKLRSNVDGPITAILSLNTIANTAGAAVAGSLASYTFGEGWLPTFSAIFTLIILLFSEVIPKTLGVIHARRLAGVVAIPLSGLVWLFQPLIWLIGLATGVLARGRQEPGMSEDEIVTLARLGSRRGVIDEGQATAIQNIVTMQGKLVREVLTPRTVLFSLPDSTTCGEAGKLEKLLVHSRIPIYGSTPDEITGLVLRRDVLASVAADQHERRLHELAQRAEFISDSATLGSALKRFLTTKRHMLIVLDEFGSVEGVVTLEDVIEEMLGAEIVDESDKVADMRDLAASQARARLGRPV